MHLWLGGELRQIKNAKAKQLLKIKIQNLLFEAQFGESAMEQTRPNATLNYTNFASSSNVLPQNNAGYPPNAQGWSNNHMAGFQGPTYTNL